MVIGCGMEVEAAVAVALGGNVHAPKLRASSSVENVDHEDRTMQPDVVETEATGTTVHPVSEIGGDRNDLVIVVVVSREGKLVVTFHEIPQVISLLTSMGKYSFVDAEEEVVHLSAVHS